jgi:hypothetical protein
LFVAHLRITEYTRQCWSGGHASAIYRRRRHTFAAEFDIQESGGRLVEFDQLRRQHVENFVLDAGQFTPRWVV